MKKTDKQSMSLSFKTVIFPLIFIVIVIALLVFSFLGIGGINPFSLFSSAPRQYSYDHMMMDTVVSVSFYSDKGRKNAGEIASKTFAEMEKFEKIFHRGLAESDIGKINENAGTRPVKVSEYTIELIKKAIHYGEISDGSFDITIAPLIDIWGFAENNKSIPEDSSIEDNKLFVDYRKIIVNEDSGEIFLPEKGMAIDLGGIAKGYIVDRGTDILKGEGIEHAFLDAGGDIRVIGGKPGDNPWIIGIQNPRQEGTRATLIAKISLFSSAIVSSGDYQRFFEEDGERYHHIINPFDGFPARGLFSVTVITPEAVDADVLSTAVFILGPEKGTKLIEELPDAEAVLITSEMEIIYTKGLEDLFEIIQ